MSAVANQVQAGGGNGTKAHPIFDIVKSGNFSQAHSMVEHFGLGVLSLRDDKGHTPAHWACLGGHTAILRYMIEHKVPVDEPSVNDLGAKPVHWACVNGHIAIVDILTQAGVDLDTIDNKHCTPLIVAAQYGQTMLAGYLMGKGARLQLTDKDGDNALHWAAFKGHSELMRLLIYSGFNPKQQDNYGQTPLHLASINGNITSVRELCEQDGVELTLADTNGKTPLMLAVGRKHNDVANFLKSEIRIRNSMLPRIDCWAIIFGPPGNSKMALLFYVCSVVLWGYPMYLIKCLPVTWYELQYYHLIFFMTNIVMWICLYHANTIDPGYLPRNIPEYDQAIKQVAHFDEWKQGKNPLTRLCHTCRTVKPLRAKHCRICNRCVIEFDHHCPYIHNCVGYNNRGWFLGFLGTLVVLSACSFYFCYYLLDTYGWDWLVVFGISEVTLFSIMIYVVTFLGLEGGLVWYHVDHFLALILSFIFLAIALCLAQSTVMHAAQNITTNERVNHKRYDYLKNEKGAFHNPFDRGLKVNLMEFFHLKPSPRDDEIQLLNVQIV